jgi:hypothetical protein
MIGNGLYKQFDQGNMRMRLSDILIQRGLVTREQVNAALEEQRQLRAEGISSRIGTLLLVERRLTPEELGEALAELPQDGFGEFGDFLVRRKAITRDQLSKALAYQAALSADEFRRYGRRRWRVLRFGRRHGPLRRPSVPKLGEILVMLGFLSAEQVESLYERFLSAFNASFY